MNNKLKRGTLPIVVLRDTVLFPKVSQQLDMVRPLSVKAVRRAIETGQEIFVTMQKDSAVDEPGPNDIYPIGVIASVKQVLKHPSTGTMRIRVECICRASVTAVVLNNESLIGFVCEREETSGDDDSGAKAYIRMLKESLKEYIQLVDNKPSKGLLDSFSVVRDVGDIVDLIAHTLTISGEQKQLLLSTFDKIERCEKLASVMKGEIELLKLKQTIESKVQESIDANQKEYYLREQLKVIGDQLGSGESPLQDSEEFRARLEKMDVPEEVRTQLSKSCDRLSKYPPGSHEAVVERNYIEACLELPWGVFSKDKLDVEAAGKKLDRDHYGLEKVKERILEFIAVRALAPDIKGQIICLVGPPGVGKTSIARSIAEAVGRKYTRISLGGIHDEADIRGHRKTYIGAMPGRIMRALKLAGSSNPLILLDEIDKLASDYRGDPTSALLEVLDPEQNVTFHDHYIDLPFDLSNVMFITTANDASAIPAPLLDRMELIELSSYTLEEKLNIAKRHLIKKQVARHGLTGKQVRFSDKAVSALIDGYTREAGVRTLEREIASLCRKAAKRIASGECEHISITDKLLPELLGPAKYRPEKTQKVMEVGTVNGLAWTSVGGTMLEIEVAVMEGTGKTELTGSLGDVMRESARTAISHVRFRAAEYGVDPDFYKTKDIHIHAPEGAVPKDGPSAGITMATALVSALSGIPVNGDVAMTGEISLRGRVLPIGGLREKSMAAMIAGVKTVIIPEDNSPDISKLSDEVRNRIKFIPVSHLDEVLKNALVDTPQFAGVSDAPAEPKDKTVQIVPQIGETNEAGESPV